MSFQTVMNVTQAPGVAGDFASSNPRHSALSVPGGFIAGPLGLTIGLFCWADTATGTILSNFGAGLPTAFVHRDQQALLTSYLQEYGMTIPAGFAAGEVFSGGDFFAVNAGAGAVAIGMKAFANVSNGTISFAATGSTVGGSTFTGVISGTNLTVSGGPTAPLAPYQAITGTGIAAGTYIVSQTSGTTGGNGVYVVNNSQTVSSETMTAAGSVETKWFAQTINAAGELVKITSTPLG